MTGFAAMRRWAPALWLALAACSDAPERPCSTCPPIEGRYQMTYEPAQTSTDCATVKAPDAPAEVEVSRVGSAARAAIAGAEATGTVFDSFQFSLSGVASADGGTLTVGLRGRYVPPSTASDGGTRIVGTLSLDQASGAKTCATTRPYTGWKK